MWENPIIRPTARVAALWMVLLALSDRPSAFGEEVLFSAIPQGIKVQSDDQSWNDLRTGSTAIWSLETKSWRPWADNYARLVSVHPDGHQVFHGASRLGVVLDDVLMSNARALELSSIQRFNPVPLWSPTGDRMAIGSQDGIHILDLDGLALALLTASHRASEFSLQLEHAETLEELPTSGRLLVVLAGIGQTGRETVRVRIFDHEGNAIVDKGESELTTGLKLAAIRETLDSGTEASELTSAKRAELTADALNLATYRTVFPDFNLLDYKDDFTWSPSGSKLAFTGNYTTFAPEASFVPDTLNAIYVVDVETGRHELMVRPEWKYYDGRPWENPIQRIECTFPNGQTSERTIDTSLPGVDVESAVEGWEQREGITCVVFPREIVTPRISEWNQISRPKWSPTGNQIAADFERHLDIYLANPDEFDTSGGNVSPRITVERNVVVFEPGSSGIGTASLRRLTTDENPYNATSFVPNWYTNTVGCWSPDGTRIAFNRGYVGVGGLEIYDQIGTYVSFADGLVPQLGGDRIKDRGGADLWVDLDPSPVRLTVEIPTPLVNAGDTATALVRVRLVATEPHTTVSFVDALLKEVAAVDGGAVAGVVSLDGADEDAVPDPFVLSSDNPEEQFPVQVTVVKPGIARLQSRIDVTDPEDETQRIVANKALAVSPLKVSLKALPLVNGKPIRNMIRNEETGAITDEEGNRIEPKIEVTIENTGDRPVRAFLQSVSPRARDRSPSPGRVRVIDEGQAFPYELQGILGIGQSKSLVYPLEIADDGRFDFVAFATAAYLNQNADPEGTTLKTIKRDAPIAVGEPYPLEVEIVLGGGNTIRSVRNGTAAIAPGSSLNLVATIRNLTSNSTIKFRGLDATNEFNAFGGAFTTEPVCPPTASFHELDPYSSVVLPAEIKTLAEGNGFGIVEWKFPEEGDIVDDLTGKSVELLPDDVIMTSEVTGWEDDPWRLRVVQNNQQPIQDFDITAGEAVGQFSYYFMTAIGEWTYGSLDSIGGIGRWGGRASVDFTAAAQELGDGVVAVAAMCEQVSNTWSKMSEAKRIEFLESIVPDVQNRALIISDLGRVPIPFDPFDSIAAFEFTKQAVYPFFSGIEEAYATQDYRKLWALVGSASGHIAIEVAMCVLPTKFATHTKAGEIAKLAENADNLRAANSQQRLLRELNGPVTREVAQRAWGIGGEELDAVEWVLRKLKMRGYARERSTRATELIEKLKVAIRKPEKMKPKGMNELDLEMLGGRDAAPKVRAHDGSKVDPEGVTAIFEPPSDDTIRLQMKARGKTEDEIELVLEKAKSRREEFAEHEEKFRKWKEEGFDVSFNYRDNGVTPPRGEPTVKRKFTYDEIELGDGRKMYVPKMVTDEGGEIYKLITGDIDWIHFCFADGSPLDSASARRLYRILQGFGLQHGETFAWIRDGQTLFKSKANQLKEYVLGNGLAEKALLEVGGESLRAARIMEEFTRFAAEGRRHLVYFDNGTKALMRLVQNADSLDRTFSILDRVFSARRVIIPSIWLDRLNEGFEEQELDWTFSGSADADVVSLNGETVQRWDGTQWIAYAPPAGGIIELSPMTLLEAEVGAGDTRLPIVPSEDLYPDQALAAKFQPGDQIVLAPGEPIQEIHSVMALGSLILGEPLAHDFPAGTIVALVPGSRMAGETDSDGDGFSDEQERSLGTNPFDPNSYFRVTSMDYRKPGVLELSWPSVAGKTYLVEYSASLEEGSWKTLRLVPGAGPSTTVTFLQSLVGSGKVRYYRVRTGQ
ncbi:MAG: hypothetical protein KDN22_27115 [Verrucomicrobiae bacterium]|nr:hypothetical protein [Verrucomicrobiae bacterium]